MDGPPFLHAAHQVRQAFDGLRAASWLAIGLGVGALILAWGRLLAWIRNPEPRPPSIVRWGEDDRGWYFELDGAGDDAWQAEAEGHAEDLLPAGDGLLRPARPLVSRPEFVISSAGVRLRL